MKQKEQEVDKEEVKKPVEVQRCLGGSALNFLTRMFNTILENDGKEKGGDVLVLIFKNRAMCSVVVTTEALLLRCRSEGSGKGKNSINTFPPNIKICSYVVKREHDFFSLKEFQFKFSTYCNYNLH